MAASEVLDAIWSVFDLLVGVVSSISSTLGLEGGLILVTIVITAASYRSQKRAGIREAIEQLDARKTTYQAWTGSNEHDRDVQIKAALNDYSILNRRTEIAFLANRINDQSARVVGHTVAAYSTALPKEGADTIRPLRERILDHKKILSLEREANKLTIVVDSTNPVVCRKIANYVLDEIDETEDNLLAIEVFRPGMP